MKIYLAILIAILIELKKGDVRVYKAVKLMFNINTGNLDFSG